MKILLLALSFFSLSAWSQVMSITLSDSHSNYNNMSKFLRLVEKDVKNFHAKHPHGKVVLLINGDYGGTSGLASVKVNGKVEGGYMGLEVLAQLAKAGVIVVFNSGNHEAHDFATMFKTNKLYVDQMTYLNNASKNIHLVSSNADFIDTSNLDNVFTKYYDIRDNVAGNNRVFSLTLDELETKSSIYRPEVLYTDIQKYEATLRKQIKQAITDGVKKVTVMIHDGTPIVQKVAETIEAEFANQIKFNVWLAAHDHIEARLATTRGTPLFNAGSQFGYVKWEETSPEKIENLKSFKMANYDFLELEEITPPNGSLSEKIGKIAETVKIKVDNLKKSLSLNKYGKVNITDNKLTMKKSIVTTTLGRSLGNTMRDWAKKGAKANFKSLPTIGIFNTSSYRLDTNLGAVDLTDLDILEMFPFSGEAKMHVLTGAQIFEVLAGTVKFQKRIGALQFSDNVRIAFKETKNTIDGSIINEPAYLEFKNASGAWSKIESSQKFLVGLDSWTAKNGYGVAYTDTYLKNNFNEDSLGVAEITSMIDMPEILRSYLPENLIQLTKSTLNTDLVNRNITAEIIAAQENQSVNPTSSGVTVRACGMVFSGN